MKMVLTLSFQLGAFIYNDKNTCAMKHGTGATLL